MSKDIAIGIVLGGAVSASLGATVDRAGRMMDGLQRKMSDTTGIKQLVGDTQRLQRELAGAEQAGRRLGLESVRKLRGEVSGLEQDWQAATAEVASLARAHAAASRAGSADAGRLAAELDKARQAAGRSKQAFEAKRQALHGVRQELRATAPPLGAIADASSRAGDAMRRQVQQEQQLGRGNGLRDRLAANVGRLREMGVEVANLDRAMQRLQRTERATALQQAGAANLHGGIELGQTTGMSIIGAAAVPTTISGGYQAEVRDMAIKAGIARSGQESELSARIAADADAARMDRTMLAQAINGLITQGMDWKQATGHGQLVAELVKGQKMAPEDVAKLIYSFGQNGVTPEQMHKTMGQLAVAGDLGAFESNMMAKYLPELMATTGALGFQGPDAARYLAASLQAQVKLTGDPDSAANNLKNLLAKVTAPEVNKIFEKAGIDLQASMRAHMQAGQNPIEAFVALSERLAAGGSADKQKQLAALKDKIRTSGNAADEQSALDAYMKMAGLGEVIQDMQARAAALAQIKYGKQIAEDLKKIESTDGVAKLKNDKAARDDTSNARWEAAKSAFLASMTEVGDAIRPLTDGAADLAAGALQWSADFSAANPGVAMGALVAGVGLLGFAASRAALGLTQLAAGKVLGALAGRAGAAGAGSVAGRAAGVLGEALDGKGVLGVQRVFVVNMPGGGLDLPDASGKGKGGRLARAGAVIKNGAGALLGAGRAALAAPSLGAIAGSGAAGVAVSGAMVAGAGAAGYAAGTALNSGITAALTASNGGRERTLGTWLYDKLHGAADAKVLAPTAIRRPVAAATAAPAAKVAPQVNQQLTFSPTVQVKVMGDAKRPDEIAAQITPHLRRLFDSWQAQQRAAGGRMFDPVGA